MKFWNNGVKNVRSLDRPGDDFLPGRLVYSRTPASEETKQRISKSLVGKKPWNKGIKTGPEPESVKKKKSEAAYRRDNSVYKGKVPWNSGLNISDSRVLAYRDSQTGQIRNGNYPRGEAHPGYNPQRREFLRYRTRVARLTEKTYAIHKNEINPLSLPRTLAGIDGGYQLDHNRSIWYGFINGITPEEISSRENLQMLPWRDNLMKSK